MTAENEIMRCARQVVPHPGSCVSDPLPSSTTRSVQASKRPVVAVDVDEVLGHFVPQLCAFHNNNHGTKLIPDDFTSYYFHEVWGGTRMEADSKMLDFFKSPYFLDGLPIVKGAVEVLRRHSETLELHVVTSRANDLADHTVKWIDANYPGVFADLHFGNHFGQGEARSKPDLCRDIDAVMIIDDNMHYATQCGEAGIRTCLFGDYAWNRTSEALPENVYRAVTWADVDVHLRTIAKGHPDGETMAPPSSASKKNDDLSASVPAQREKATRAERSELEESSPQAT